MTGRDALRNGAYSWAYGHECIFPEIPTIVEIFKDNGYRTGHFGKWQLGDTYPFRPHDRGFEESIHHKGAAITQSPDYGNNDYFDDYYWEKDELWKYQGYCTDVWFAEARKSMWRTSIPILSKNWKGIARNGGILLSQACNESTSFPSAARKHRLFNLVIPRSLLRGR